MASGPASTIPGWNDKRNTGTPFNSCNSANRAFPVLSASRHEWRIPDGEDYELFLYSLPERFPSIRRSTITFVRLGATLARIAGELYFDHGFRVVVRERFVYNRLPAALDWYGYEVWQDDEKLFWYDPQPHPNDPELQSTHPHHKHIPPDIKHHRIPAPDMRFDRSNLPIVIDEVQRLIEDLLRSQPPGS